MRRILLVSIFLLPLVSRTVIAQTLCGKEETDFFSCETANYKIISVCGKITEDGIGNESWLQYRFGRWNNIELAFPKSKENSIEKFEGNWFDKYNVIDLRFINKNTAYSVSLNEEYDGIEAQKRKKASGGVYVKLRAGTRILISCASVNARKYYGVFGELNSRLRAINGESDIFYKEKMY